MDRHEQTLSHRYRVRPRDHWRIERERKSSSVAVPTLPGNVIDHQWQFRRVLNCEGLVIRTHTLVLHRSEGHRRRIRYARIVVRNDGNLQRPASNDGATLIDRSQIINRRAPLTDRHDILYSNG